MIQKRGSRWRVVVQAGRDPLTGVRRQLSGSATTEREAVRLERRLRLQVQGGAVGTITLADLVTEWWASKPRLAPTTQANYRDNLDNHILPVLGSKRVEDIRPRLVGAFLQHLQAKKGLGVSLLPGIPDLGAYPTPGGHVDALGAGHARTSAVVAAGAAGASVVSGQVAPRRSTAAPSSSAHV
jgi:hypothetical protein